MESSEAPLIAANPPTNAPINAVIKINSKDEPPNGKSCAILCDSIFSFFVSIHSATINHRTKIPKNPDRKLLPIDCPTKSATIKAIIAMLHHGNCNPAMKLNNAVRIIAKTNRILKF